MKHFSFSAFLLGIGFGLILSFFISLNAQNDQPSDPKDEILKIPDSVVIERAKELGFIDPTEGISKSDIRIGE